MVIQMFQYQVEFYQSSFSTSEVYELTNCVNPVQLRTKGSIEKTTRVVLVYPFVREDGSQLKVEKDIRSTDRRERGYANSAQTQQ